MPMLAANNKKLAGHHMGMRLRKDSKSDTQRTSPDGMFRFSFGRERPAFRHRTGGGHFMLAFHFLPAPRRIP